MWTIIKFDKKRINLMKQDLIKKTDSNLEIYSPKLLIERYHNNKITKKQFNLLGDYLFCFHKKFEDDNYLQQVKNSRGLKYFLDGCKISQKDISKFIELLKSAENEQGFITKSFYDIKINSIYKFHSGPFVNKIFKIVNLQKNKIDILMGKFKTRINKIKFLFAPI